MSPARSKGQTGEPGEDGSKGLPGDPGGFEPGTYIHTITNPYIYCSIIIIITGAFSDEDMKGRKIKYNDVMLRSYCVLIGWVTSHDLIAVELGH